MSSKEQCEVEIFAVRWPIKETDDGVFISGSGPENRLNLSIGRNYTNGSKSLKSFRKKQSKSLPVYQAQFAILELESINQRGAAYGRAFCVLGHSGGYYGLESVRIS